MSSLVWVLAASLLIWGAFFAYMMATDLRLRALEERFDRQNKESGK